MKREIYPQIQIFFRFYIALIRTSLLFRLELLTHSTNIWQFKLLIPHHFAKKRILLDTLEIFQPGHGPQTSSHLLKKAFAT